jgi:DNA-binding response OmpR family regulator
MHKDRILIVDDEQINVDFFEVMLSKLGFTVEKAEDGEQALARIIKHPPDLIILDNLMPRLTGWELARLLKQDPEYEQYRDIPIVMLSALDDVKDKIEGYEIGVDDYITKPFNFSEVLSRIKAVLRNKDLSQQIRKRELRLAVIENLNKSLIYFAGHVRNPVSEILNAARKLAANDPAAVQLFLAQVVQESETILATIEGLEEQIRDMKSQEGQLRESEMSLAGLEEKYQKHFKSLRDKERGVQGVR